MPITHVTFACGAFALAGLPPLSGFWSKDEILAVAREAGHDSPFPILYLIVFASLLLTSLLTAFYTSRAFFRTFWGPEKIPHEAGSHGHFHDEPHEPADEVAAHDHAPIAHESPAVMTIPLIVLALGAIGIGGVLAYHHIFASFINRGEDVLLFLKKREPHPNVVLMAISGVASLIGIAAAWALYVAKPAIPPRMAAAVPALYRASQNRFYFDELYGWIAVGPLAALAVISRIFDLLVDGVVDLVGRLPKLVAALLRPLQNGLVQFYALAMLLALTVFLVVLVWS
jgi:NADH-quinone oxidoreductase subunit L